MQIAMPVNELQSIILYKFQDEYLVHMMYKEHASFGIGFSQKVYSLLIHKPLEQFTFLYEIMGHFEHSVRENCEHVDNFVNNYKTILDKCITHVDKHNASCLAKKQLRLYQIVTDYRLSEGDFKSVKALITSFEAEWRYSMYALSEKEKC